MAVKFKEDSLRDLALTKRGITPPEDWTNPANVRTAKKAAIGQDCSNAIFAGVTVGDKHYTLSDRDQQNINFLVAQAAQGAAVSYHADGELCRQYTPEEFIPIGIAAATHVTYHTTLVNHYNRWLEELDDIDAITAVEYHPELQGGDLPPELRANFAAIMGFELPDDVSTTDTPAPSKKNKKTVTEEPNESD
jgi:hypothetical protein